MSFILLIFFVSINLRKYKELKAILSFFLRLKKWMIRGMETANKPVRKIDCKNVIILIEKLQKQAKNYKGSAWSELSWVIDFI